MEQGTAPEPLSSTDEVIGPNGSGPFAPAGNFGGLAVDMFNSAGNRVGTCTGAFPVKFTDTRGSTPKDSTGLLTAGHCFNRDPGPMSGSYAQVTACDRTSGGQKYYTDRREYGVGFDGAVLTAKNSAGNALVFQPKMYTGRLQNKSGQIAVHCFYQPQDRGWASVASGELLTIGSVSTHIPDANRTKEQGETVCKFGQVTGFNCDYKLEEGPRIVGKTRLKDYYTREPSTTTQRDRTRRSASRSCDTPLSFTSTPQVRPRATAGDPSSPSRRR